MGFYTTWYIADAADAEAIASTLTSDNRPEDKWPQLSLRNIGLMELGYLWSILDGEPIDDFKLTVADLLFGDPDGDPEDDEPHVSRVEPEFIDALAAISPDDVPRYAAEWLTVDEMMYTDSNDLVKIIEQLSSFARQAKQAGKPVLET